MKYARRDTESLGKLYIEHVEAMTAEGLHSKADIAAELAWRDEQIEILRKACIGTFNGSADLYIQHMVRKALDSTTA